MARARRSRRPSPRRSPQQNVNEIRGVRNTNHAPATNPRDCLPMDFAGRSGAGCRECCRRAPEVSMLVLPKIYPVDAFQAGIV